MGDNLFFNNGPSLIKTLPSTSIDLRELQTLVIPEHEFSYTVYRLFLTLIYNESYGVVPQALESLYML